MSGVSTKEIKNRIRSMESTKQITKAMEMVAASKLRRAQAQVANARPYFEILSETMGDIVRHSEDFHSVYLMKRAEKKTAYVIIAGDRGLAGGYNSNVLKTAQKHIGDKAVTILPVGKKTMDFYQSKGFSLFAQTYREAGSVSVGDCFSMAKQLCNAFRAAEIDAVYVVYTNFVSALSQVPQVQQLLPLQSGAETTKGNRTDMIYEPDGTAVFDIIVPEYLGGVLYGALCESRASEQAARRSAMDSATKNADEMIDDLSLKFNRARQAAITQEITEIVAGA